MSDPQNTQGTPGEDEEADTASGGAPEPRDDTEDDSVDTDDQTTNGDRSG